VSQLATGGAPILDGRRRPSFGGTSRMTRECQVRICERLGVKFPGPTRQRCETTRTRFGPRTGSSNPPPSSRESTNFRFLRRAIAREEARRSGSRSGKTTPQATTSSSTRRLLPGSKALRRPGTGIEKGDPASRCRPASSARLRPPESAVDESSRASLDTHFRRHSRGRASGPSARFHPR